MKTFQEFIQEGLKAKLRTAYIQGRKENEPQVTSFVLPRATNPTQPGTPERAAEIKHAQKHSGGGAVEKAIKKREKQLQKDAKKAVKRILSVKEDIESRRKQLRQRQLDQMAAYKEKVSSYQQSQAKKKRAKAEREELKKELKKELQTEQTPAMEPNAYNVAIAKQQAMRKKARESHAQREMEHEAQAQQAAKQRRLKAIMSR